MSVLIGPSSVELLQLCLFVYVILASIFQFQFSCLSKYALHVFQGYTATYGTVRPMWVCRLPQVCLEHYHDDAVYVQVAVLLAW